MISVHLTRVFKDITLDIFFPLPTGREVGEVSQTACLSAQQTLLSNVVGAFIVLRGFMTF